MNFVIIQNPGGVGADAVAGEQCFSQPRGELGGGVFPGVNGAGDENFGLGARNGRIGELEHKDVVAA